jgi:hypothetical protein
MPFHDFFAQILREMIISSITYEWFSFKGKKNSVTSYVTEPNALIKRQRSCCTYCQKD